MLQNMPSMAEASAGFSYCFWKCRVPGTKGLGSGVFQVGRIVDNDAGRRASSLSIPPQYLPRSCNVFLSDDPHFILTVTREDVEQ